MQLVLFSSDDVLHVCRQPLKFVKTASEVRISGQDNPRSAACS